jgi:LPS sulfotransferase NodH
MTASPSGQFGSQIRLSYLICTTPRTGSNFLCEVLRSTGVAGRPDDYFWNPAFWQERWDTPDFDAYLQRILKEGTTPNRIFGAKLMWHDLDELLPTLATFAGIDAASPPALLGTIFPNLRYLWLTRRDKVRQAISWYRALATRAWRSTDQQPPSSGEPAFSFPEVDRLVQQSIKGDQEWQQFFQRHGIEPLVIAYEDLADDPARTAIRILDHLGLPSPAAPWPSAWQHQQQADALTDAWVRQYHALKREAGAASSTPTGSCS